METRTREKCWTEICMAKANTPTGGSPARAKIDSTKSSGGISRTMFSVRIFSPFGFVPPSLVLCPFLSSHFFSFLPSWLGYYFLDAQLSSGETDFLIHR